MRRLSLIFLAIITGVFGVGATLMAHCINDSKGVMWFLILFLPILFMGIGLLIYELYNEYKTEWKKQ